MSRMKSPDEPKIRFEITRDRPEDSLQRMAIQLAEALTKSSTYQVDANTFSEAANAERQKAQQLQGVLFQIKERQKNPPTKVSRMDPLAEYDLESCEKQFEELKKTAQKMQEIADEHFSNAENARREADSLQRKIHKAQKNVKD